MISLTVPELKKKPWLIELLKSKILKGVEFDAFINNKMEKVTLIKDPKIIKALTLANIHKFGGTAYNRLMFTTTDNVEIPLTSFNKTAEFGAGNTSGAGPDVMVLVECGFCVMASSLLQLNKIVLEEDKLQHLDFMVL